MEAVEEVEAMEEADAILLGAVVMLRVRPPLIVAGLGARSALGLRSAMPRTPRLMVDTTNYTR